MSERTERLIFLLNKNDLRQVEEFGHANQIPSRAAAIRELLRRALMRQHKVVGPDDVNLNITEGFEGEPEHQC